jgi:Flp pilus assembly pilin Flp
MKSLIKRFIADEKAAEVTELGIVLALIVAGSVATIALIGPKIKSAYDTVNTAIPASGS